MHKISVIDVETGKESSLSGTDKTKRSKAETKKDQLISFMLYGKERTDFYGDQEQPLPQFLDIVLDFATGTDKDVLFLSRCILYAKKKSINNELSIIALLALSLNESAYAKNKFRVLFPKVIVIPSDLQFFMYMVKLKAFRGFGKLIRTSLADWLNAASIGVLSVLSVYPQTERSSSPRIKDFTLRDLIRLSHVKGSNQRKQAIYNFIMRGTASKYLPSVIPATKELFNNRTTQAKFDELIEKNNFFVYPVKNPSTPKAWNSLFQSTDMERSLSSLMKYETEVFKERDNINLFTSVLCDKEKVLKMKHTPFDYSFYYDNYSARSVSQKEEVKLGLKMGIENSYGNLSFYKKTAIIIVDQSQATKVSQSLISQINDSTILSTYAAIFSKIFEKAYIVPFDSTAQVIEDLPKDTISRSDYITYSMKGLTRDYKQPFNKILQEELKCDVLIALTTNNSWFSILRNTDAGTILSNYMNNVNVPEKSFYITLSSGHIIRENHSLRNAHFMYGLGGMYKFIDLQLDKEHKDKIQSIEF